MANQRIRKIFPNTLRSSWPADQLQDTESPRCLNVRFKFGSVRNTPGRAQITGPPVAEEARSFGRYPTVDGTEWILLLTESKIFRFGSAAPATPRAWIEILPTSTAIAVNPRKWSTVTAEDKFFFTNGGDIFRWPDGLDPTTGTYDALVDVATGGTPPGAKFLEYFNDRLITGWTTEGANTFPYRIRWPINANHLDWSGTGSGFLDLLEESQEPITALRGLGDRLVVYKEHAIIDIIRTGILTPVFEQQVRVRGLGTKYPYTLASNGVNHFFLGTDGRIYIWDGIQPTHISEDIDEELRALVYPTEAESYFGMCSIDRGEYWLVLGPSDVFVFDYLRNSWTRDSFPNIITLAEVDDAQTSYTWLTIPGTWEQQSTTWDQLRGSQFTTIWAGREDGGVFRVDDSFVDDYYSSGSIIDKNIETPDFYLSTDPLEQITLRRLTLHYDFVNDETVEVSYSFDKGMTWQSHVITPNQAGITVVDTNASGHIVRFRLRSNNAIGQFRWKQYSAEFVAAGPYQPPDSV